MRDRADAVVAEVLLDLADEVRRRLSPAPRVGLVALDRDRVVDLGQLVGEHGLDDDALDLLDPADVACAVLAPARFCSAVLASIFVSLDERLGAGDDFHDLLRDVRLALAVHLQGVRLDELARVLGGVAHRGHARAVLGRGRLEQRAEDRDLDVDRDEPLEDLVRARARTRRARAVALRPRACSSSASSSSAALEDRRLLQRQQRLARDPLLQRRDVAVVEDLDAVDVAVDVGGDQVGGDLARVGVRRAGR